jgi:tRNA U34 5-carboxymethylaminomethyl modifying enzyme MnmG/GidA
MNNLNFENQILNYCEILVNLDDEEFKNAKEDTIQYLENVCSDKVKKFINLMINTAEKERRKQKFFKLLGHQAIPVDELQTLWEIQEHNNKPENSIGMLMDAYNYGYIQRKRVERKKRKTTILK